MNFEDYNKQIEQIKNNGFELLKEDFDKQKAQMEKELEFIGKIQELANSYYEDVPNKEILGYYKIIQYSSSMLQQIDERIKLEE